MTKSAKKTAPKAQAKTSAKAPSKAKQAKTAESNAPAEELASPAEGESEAATIARKVERVTVQHGQVFPSPLNPRQDWESAQAVEDLKSLADDVAENGLIQGLYLKPHTDPDSVGLLVATDANGVRLPAFEIVAGERRWRALGLAITQGKLPADHPIEATVEAIDELRHRKLALAENIRRRNLNPIEEAKAFEAIIRLGGGRTAEIAEEVGATQRMVQQRLQLLQLPEADQAKVASGQMSIESARYEIQRINGNKIKLEPAEWLLLLEIAAKIERDPAKADELGLYGSKVTEVGDAAKDAVDAVPAVRALVSVKHRHRDGRSFVSLNWQTADKIKASMPEFSGNTRAGLLERLRREVMDDAEANACKAKKSYAHAWLNGPFEVPAEILADVEAKKAAREAEEKARADREAFARDAALSRAKTVEEIRQAANCGPVVTRDLGFAEAAQMLNRPLPWTVNEHGNWLDGNGSIFSPYAYQEGDDRSLKRLMVIALNAMAGLATPEKFEPADVPTIDRLLASVNRFFEDGDEAVDTLTPATSIDGLNLDDNTRDELAERLADDFDVETSIDDVTGTLQELADRLEARAKAPTPADADADEADAGAAEQEAA